MAAVAPKTQTDVTWSEAITWSKRADEALDRARAEMVRCQQALRRAMGRAEAASPDEFLAARQDVKVAEADIERASTGLAEGVDEVGRAKEELDRLRPAAQAAWQAETHKRLDPLAAEVAKHGEAFARALEKLVAEHEEIRNDSRRDQLPYPTLESVHAALRHQMIGDRWNVAPFVAWIQDARTKGFLR